ncbi:hypothetical protein TOPH_03057 [Tolypocladium ophioglossoides CBS 100239]|uniref:Transcription factor domain-containing protein n=1 Tax=Tolypocladium ophioglossoides (strain CBS 100239) TaxID=1163406 RepID=A0A0L0NDD5_TOLOC|nr:hypothetical protein TOPH_03057 [Tolypocladium ophioglossoides CBS 100239]
MHSSSQMPSPSSPSSQPQPSRLDSLAAAAAANPQTGTSFCLDQTPCNDITLSQHTKSGYYVRPEPTPEEAEVYLSKFRDWLTNFPFMHMPPGLTAKDLRRERPFLWMVREEVARRLVLNHERTMDMLLGLLAYLGWATMNTGPGTKPFLILYSQMAATILFEMGLTRTPEEEQQCGLYLRVWSIRPAPPPKIRTMEERRAVLAFWFCTSVCTSFIGKMEALGSTSHMDDCLAVLERDGEEPLDEVLVALVKIQLIGEEAHKLLRREVAGETGQGPTYIFKAGLQSRLNEIQQRLPAKLHSHYVVQSQMYSVEAQVHSISLFADQSIPETMRISAKYACTKAARAWFDTFFAVPLMEVPGLPFAVYVSMSHMQAILYRLTTSEDPA